MNDKNAHKKWSKQRKRQLETKTNTSQPENRKKKTKQRGARSNMRKH